MSTARRHSSWRSTGSSGSGVVSSSGGASGGRNGGSWPMSARSSVPACNALVSLGVVPSRSVTFSSRQSYTGGTTVSAGTLQLGTGVDCDGNSTTPTYYAWWELVPASSVRIKLKIFPGDTINAAVLVNGQTLTFSLKDLTRGTRFSKVLTTSQPLDTGSAEWIAEAPSECTVTGFCRTVPLTNFGSARRFRNSVTFFCSATLNAIDEGGRGSGHKGFNWSCCGCTSSGRCDCCCRSGCCCYSYGGC